MEIAIPAEVFEGALSTLKNFVHKPGSDSATLTMSATHIVANEEDDTVTFVGNNPSQKIAFTIEAKVVKSGEALVSVADALTALSTISDKSQEVRVSLGDNSLDIRSKTVSVQVQVFDLATAAVTPKAPKEAEGDLLSITVDAQQLPTVFARSTPGLLDSTFDKILMWVDGDEFSMMSLSNLGTSFASMSGAKATGEIPLVLWEPGNLRRIMSLVGSADEVLIRHDSAAQGGPSAAFTVTVKAKDTTFVVEQALEQVPDVYLAARNKLLPRAVQVRDTAETTVTISAGELVRAMESAERISGMGRKTTTFLAVEDKMLEVYLPDDSFSEQLSSAKTEGTFDRALSIHSKLTLSLLSALGSDAKVTLHLPAGNAPEGNATGRTAFALMTCQDSNLSPATKGLPASGFWGLTSFRAATR